MENNISTLLAQLIKLLQLYSRTTSGEGMVGPNEPLIIIWVLQIPELLLLKELGYNNFVVLPPLVVGKNTSLARSYQLWLYPVLLEVLPYLTVVIIQLSMLNQLNGHDRLSEREGRYFNLFNLTNITLTSLHVVLTYILLHLNQKNTNLPNL